MIRGAPLVALLLAAYTGGPTDSVDASIPPGACDGGTESLTAGICPTTSGAVTWYSRRAAKTGRDCSG